LYQADVSEAWIDLLTGHDQNGGESRRRYLKGVPLPQLRGALERVTWPELDLSALYAREAGNERWPLSQSSSPQRTPDPRPRLPEQPRHDEEAGTSSVKREAGRRRLRVGGRKRNPPPRLRGVGHHLRCQPGSCSSCNSSCNVLRILTDAE
jgi:hypothetical protein